MSKTFVGAGCVFLLAFAVLASDDPTRVWSQPSPPSQEALDRLNLQLAWAVHVPMDGRRDRFASIQVSGDQLIVQTRSGLITVLDAENGGRALWRSRPGRAYQSGLPPTYNGRAVFASDSGKVFALDRETGALQWDYDLDVALSAPVQADDTQMYLCNVQRHVITLHLPAMSSTAPAAPPPSPDEEKKPADEAAAPAAKPASTPAKADAEEVRPLFAWDYQTNERIDDKPAQSKHSLFLSLPGGGYMALPKTPRTLEANAELYTYAGDSRFSATPGSSDNMAFLPTEDAHVYAVSIDSGKARWRYISGTAVVRPPIAVDVSDGGPAEKDLYVMAEHKGLARLNRDTGEPLWSLRKQDYNPEADHFLAVNPKFVYAADRVGRLLVMDRKNGVLLSRFDVHDFVFPVVNGDTDRIYLAANDGLIVCLHDKDYPTSLQYKKVVRPPAEKSLEERIRELKAKLAKPITEPEAPAPIPFKTYVDNVNKKYGLKMFVSQAAFKDGMVPSPDDQMVKPAAVDNKPLGEALQGVLDQVGASYTISLDTIVIGPGKPKGP